MERSKLGRFLDNIFLCFVLFIISLSFLKMVIKNKIFSLIIAFVLMFVFFRIILFFQNNRLRKLSLQTKEKQAIIDYNFALRCLSKSSQTTFFKNMLKDKNIKQSSSGLVLENSVLLYNALDQEVIDNSTLFLAYSKAKNMRYYKIKEVVLLCNDIKQNSNSLVKNFIDIRFTIFTPLEMYAMMKNYDCFPALLEKKIKTKPNFFREVFVRKQAKNFIKCSLLLYISSLFVPFTKYYIISASICMLIAGICLCLDKKEPPINNLAQMLLLTKQKEQA